MTTKYLSIKKIAVHYVTYMKPYLLSDAALQDHDITEALSKRSPNNNNNNTTYLFSAIPNGQRRLKIKQNQTKRKQNFKF